MGYSIRVKETNQNHMTTSFDFDSIQSPSDLAQANDEVKSPLGVAMEAMGDVGFKGSMAMAIWLMDNAANWHEDMAIDKADGRKAATAWAIDAGKLRAAISILTSLDYGDPEPEAEAQEEEKA